MKVMTDIEIAREAQLLPIKEVAAKIGIDEEALIPYGYDKAKIAAEKIKKRGKRGRLILVTAMNPTPAGEGKTTVSIGLADAFSKLGKKVCAVLREPSLGPVFGIKGGATGGGRAQVAPMEDINLHFTGDFHAIGAANNLLSAMIDNHIFQGNKLGIDPRTVTWKRAVDMNDRALRHVIVGIGGKSFGVPREDSYNITVASEVMAVLCLSKNIGELKEKLGRMTIGETYDGKAVYCSDIKAEGAMAVLLKDAIKPNLVQTLEGTPAILHGGPFANIAHGCNSLIATDLAMDLADYVVTEAGFGADLGAEKFLDIKCRKGGFFPSASVLVATVRSLKYHGGIPKDRLNEENTEALKKGFPNLLRHARNLREVYGINPVIAVNRFSADTEPELSLLEKMIYESGFECARTEVWADGGEGALGLAEKVISTADFAEPEARFSYALDEGVEEKIKNIAEKIYHAGRVEFSAAALSQIREIEERGLSNLPVCVAKTQYSFSDNPKLLGAPENFELHVRGVRIASGAGFIICLTGNVMTMPGLPKKPAAETIDIDENGIVSGIF